MFTCAANALPLLCCWGKGENIIYSEKYVVGSLALHTVMLCLSTYRDVVFMADTCCSLGKPVLDGSKAQDKGSRAGS